MKRFGIGIVVAGLIAVAFGGPACQAIVGSDLPAYTCSGTSADACPLGQYCKGAGCVACEPAGRDVCDGFDNDCDGKIDNGPLSDQDNDTFPRCRVDGTAPDCDDSDPSIFPGATETCNGRDDDCDNTIDNPEKACPTGQLCTRAGSCIPSASACNPRDPNSCPSTKFCDPDSLECVERNTKFGSVCQSDASCETGLLCADETMLTKAITAKSGGSICTKACCTSSDCPDNFVCFAAATGGNYCVKRSFTGRGPAGTAAAGAVCASGENCRSGLCDSRTKRCIDSCCRATDCASGTTCTLGTIGDHEAFVCADPKGETGAGNTCSSDDACESGVCAKYQFSFLTKEQCAAPCCGASQCGQVSFGFFGTYKTTCNNEKVSSGAIVNVCDRYTSSNGQKVIGEACTQAGECASNRCVDTKLGKRCTDVCCTDRDCPSTWLCRTSTISIEGANSKVLRCVPQ